MIPPFRTKLDACYQLSESLAHNHIAFETHLKRYVCDPTDSNKHLAVRAYHNLERTLSAINKEFSLSESLALNLIAFETHLKRYVCDPTDSNKHLAVRAYHNLKRTLSAINKEFSLSSPSLSEMGGVVSSNRK